MEQLEILRQWLRSFPGWGDVPVHIDTLPVQTENAGVYPLGLEVLERKEDLLGNVRLRCRQRFDLYKTVSPGEDHAQWLLELQHWVLEQCAMGQAPRFGDVPSAEHIRAEKGKLKEITAAGTAVYAVTITAEFIKIMEENEYGKN